MKARFLVTDPSHYSVRYVINPWMQPELWRRNGEANAAAARNAWERLIATLRDQGCEVDVMPGQPGLPDLVFPANAAIVLDRRALLSRFRHAERRGEEPHIRAFFGALKARGVLDEVAELPEGIFQEGAGDAMWDTARRVLWAGFGPRSSPAALDSMAAHFGCEVVGLELVREKFYHLDTAFCPLSKGEIMFYPDAFSPESIRTIRDRVPSHLLIEAGAADANAFALNAVNVGRTIVTTQGGRELRPQLEDRGYRCIELDLSPFMMSGGAAYCMTQRLDLVSAPAQNAAVEKCLELESL